MSGIVHTLIISMLMLAAGILMILLRRNLHFKWLVSYAFYLPITTILYVGIPTFQTTEIHSLVRYVDYLVFLAAFYEIARSDSRGKCYWVVPLVLIILFSATLFPSYGYWYFLPRIFYPAISVFILYAWKKRHFLLLSFCIFSLLETVGDIMLLVWKLTSLDVYNLQVSLVLWNSTLFAFLLFISVFVTSLKMEKISKTGSNNGSV